LTTFVQASLEFHGNGSDLICKLTSTGDTLTIVNWAVGSDYQVENFAFNDGPLTTIDIIGKKRKGKRPGLRVYVH
jgi:hypothetical protein